MKSLTFFPEPLQRGKHLYTISNLLYSRRGNTSPKNEVKK